jgi:hypothetical protein
VSEQTRLRLQNWRSGRHCRCGPDFAQTNKYAGQNGALIKYLVHIEAHLNLFIFQSQPNLAGKSATEIDPPPTSTRPLDESIYNTAYNGGLVCQQESARAST